jgi:hypothetical protein
MSDPRVANVVRKIQSRLDRIDDQLGKLADVYAELVAEEVREASGVQVPLIVAAAYRVVIKHLLNPVFDPTEALEAIMMEFESPGWQKPPSS